MRKGWLTAAGMTVALVTALSAQADGPRLGTFGVDLSGMEKSVAPGDDFFDYANGAWQRAAVIPGDRTQTGSFPDLTILSEQRLHEIVLGLQAVPRAELDDEGRKLRDLYDAFTNTGRIEARGLDPIRADLAFLAAPKTLDDVARVMGDTVRPTPSLFASGISVDQKHPTSYVTLLGQSGLGLPSRDYYLKDDPPLAKTRQSYRTYLEEMLTLAGMSDAGPRAQAVLDLETRIAQVHWAPAERRNADKTYNPMTFAQLEAYAPQFPWRTFLAALGIPAKGPNGDRQVIVRENTAFPQLANIFAETPVPVWRDWSTLQYLHNMSPFLPKRFDDLDFGFYGKVLSGQAQPLPRETRGVQLLDRLLGEALGKRYVAKYFPSESKAKVEALVRNLLAAYEADIRTITWMTDATKQQALEKLRKFRPYVGYPDKWRDYSALAIDPDDLVGSVERTHAFDWRRDLDRIDGPVDRDEWGMTPPTVNAYYAPPLNAIVFPAAILQPPFFDPAADDAVNYGGIGAVMGHEIGHGFDDQGSKYDGDGVLRDWWTDADRLAFEARVAALGTQFDSYEGVPGLHVNGQLTMGENIGDLSGVSIALQAYHLSLGGKPAPVIDGFTGDQRFFLGFAQVWRVKVREERQRQLLLSNPHSPPHWRVIGPLRNVDAWYAAFDITPGGKYYLPPGERVRIW